MLLARGIEPRVIEEVLGAGEAGAVGEPEEAGRGERRGVPLVARDDVVDALPAGRMAKAAKTNRRRYTVRAKTGRKDESDRDIFVTVGAAWPFGSGDGFTVRLNTLPVNVDGTLMLVPPKQE